VRLPAKLTAVSVMVLPLPVAWPGGLPCPWNRGTVDAVACRETTRASGGANEVGPTGSGCRAGSAQVPSWLAALAALLYSGVAVNLLALRHEICTVLVIEDPRWYERESGELRICDEFLQQCEQAELLPDQRWVQLISLTRPGLEVEPVWWDRLRASTIVAPGAAAVELGLQVARAVVS
jgi:hypothetical protein